jgi:predicted KAP-like P-loop ATPase
MWSDNETIEDLIGFQVHADLIRTVVTDSKLLPVTIGVFGDWGNGKTSIMHMLRRDLDPANSKDAVDKARNEQIAVLYFNGWLFEGYDDAKAALLSSILGQLKNHKRFGPKIRDEAIALLKRVNLMRLAKLGWRTIGAPLIGTHLATLTGAMPPQMGAVVGAIAAGGTDDTKDSEKDSILKPEENTDVAMDIRKFREDFARMIKDSGISSLVVLIDDLDRCSPETIIDNLEAIKLFLNVDGTAFVIGADPRIVRHAITVRYHDILTAGRQSAEEDMRIADDYLEKLIQVPYSLPRLSPAEIETYMTLLFCYRDLPSADYAACLTKCRQLRVDNRFRSFGFANVKEALGQTAMPSRLHDALSLLAVAATLITECLKGNPRQVKRFLNAYTLRRKLAEVAKMDTLRDEVLIKLMLLEYAEPSRFKDLAKWQEEDRGYPKKLKALEETILDANAGGQASPQINEWETERIRRWVALPPRLSDVDLSDYFWLVRDKLASSMTGLTMVPPIVRKVFEGLLKKASRPAAVATIKDLTTDDYVALHDLLTRNLMRQPDGADAFDAFKALVDTRPDSAKAFATALVGLPTDRMSASLPGQIKLMIQNRTALQDVFSLVLEKISKDPTSKAGKALSATGKKGR